MDANKILRFGHFGFALWPHVVAWCVAAAAAAALMMMMGLHTPDRPAHVIIIITAWPRWGHAPPTRAPSARNDCEDFVDGLYHSGDSGRRLDCCTA